MGNPNEAGTGQRSQSYRSASWFAPPAPTRGRFLSRVRRGARYAASLVGVTLACGMVGYPEDTTDR